MKTGINIWVYFLILAGLSACDTKQDWFDSGISSPYHDCSIMEYLQKDTANWKLTVELIERADLTQLFEGKDPNYKEITFFAPPSLSILRYVWDKAWKEQFPESLIVGERSQKMKKIIRNISFKHSTKIGVGKWYCATLLKVNI